MATGNELREQRLKAYENKKSCQDELEIKALTEEEIELKEIMLMQKKKEIRKYGTSAKTEIKSNKEAMKEIKSKIEMDHKSK
jgi:hypothetical protein